jgi:DNA-binding HxlR family transcriptional regulator
MQRASFGHMNCSVAQCLEVVGEWWSLLIVRDALAGVPGSTSSPSASGSRRTC